MIKFLLYLFLSLLFECFSKELFGYKLHSDIYQYAGDGEIIYNKKDIDSIELAEDRVQNP